MAKFPRVYPKLKCTIVIKRLQEPSSIRKYQQIKVRFKIIIPEIVQKFPIGNKAAT